MFLKLFLEPYFCRGKTIILKHAFLTLRYPCKVYGYDYYDYYLKLLILFMVVGQ